MDEVEFKPLIGDLQPVRERLAAIINDPMSDDPQKERLFEFLKRFSAVLTNE